MTLSKHQEEALKRIRFSRAKYIIGVDEVGTGAWAGPIVVVGTVFYKGWGHPEVRDSKKLTDKKRRRLAHDIKRETQYLLISKFKAEELDRQGGLGPSIKLLTANVIRGCLVHYPNSVVVVDGDYAPKIPEAKGKLVALAKGDDLVPAVGAASIVAKVYRDDIMIRLHEQWPGYNFKKNRGYHSQGHKHHLDTVGPCEIHRLTYGPVRKAIMEQIRRVESLHGKQDPGAKRPA